MTILSLLPLGRFLFGGAYSSRSLLRSIFGRATSSTSVCSLITEYVNCRPEQSNRILGTGKLITSNVMHGWRVVHHCKKLRLYFVRSNVQTHTSPPELFHREASTRNYQLKFVKILVGHLSLVPFIELRNNSNIVFNQSLILAQDECWRRG